MFQMRVPGGTVDAKYLSYVEHIAKTWGDGIFHLGTRQNFDIPGIPYDNIAGCPNDCNKAHMCDFGIIGVARMTYHPERCIACGACVRACAHGATPVHAPYRRSQGITFQGLERSKKRHARRRVFFVGF